MPEEERKAVGQKARDYVLSEFSYDKTIDMWHDSLLNLVNKWKEDKPKLWTINEVQV